MRISWESQNFPCHLLTINNFISGFFANIQRKCRRLHILFAPPNRDRLKVDLNILMNSYKFQKGNDVKNIQLLMELFFKFTEIVCAIVRIVDYYEKHFLPGTLYRRPSRKLCADLPVE